MSPSSKDESTVATDASASSLSYSLSTIVFPAPLDGSNQKGRRPPSTVATVPHSALEKREVLGFGSFSDVYEVKILCHRRVNDDGPPAFDPHRAYAAKMLRRITKAAGGRSKGSGSADNNGMHRLAHAAKDLAEEAALLSRLPRHENVIALRALSHGFFEDPSTGFLLLDRLAETLQDKLERWRSEAKRASGTTLNVEGPGRRSMFGFLTRTGNRTSLARAETLRGAGIGIPLAKAMDFLHRNHVIFRDISPSNIGFDEAGTLKLFDFGTARSFTADRVMTCFTGTPRYMSPEVMVGDPYGLAADVYSFAVVLWEVSATSLQKPYALIRDLAAAKRSIVGMQYRPPIHQVRNRRLQRLIQAGWDPHPHLRPTFSFVVSELESLRDAVTAA